MQARALTSTTKFQVQKTIPFLRTSNTARTIKSWEESRSPRREEEQGGDTMEELQAPSGSPRPRSRGEHRITRSRRRSGSGELTSESRSRRRDARGKRRAGTRPEVGKQESQEKCPNCRSMDRELDEGSGGTGAQCHLSGGVDVDPNLREGCSARLGSRSRERSPRREHHGHKSTTRRRRRARSPSPSKASGARRSGDSKEPRRRWRPKRSSKSREERAVKQKR